MPKDKQTKITNKKLAALFFSSQWLIEEGAAREALAQYLREEAAIAEGSDYFKLGISERRQALATVLLNSKGEALAFNSDNLATGNGQIAHIKLKGTMFTEDQFCTRGATSIARDIQIAGASPNVDAIIIEVNSGGGQAKAAPVIANAIKDTSKPVIAYVHTAASAAYWAIAGADEIVLSSKQAETGSIGVMATIDKMMAEVQDLIYEDVYSDLSTDKNKEWRAYKEGNKGPLKARLNKMAKIFHNEVKANRSLSEELKESTLSGGMFFANESIKRGLADRIGTMNTAIARARTWKKKKRKTQTNANMTFKQKLYAKLAKLTGKKVETEEQAEEALQSLEANKADTEALANATAQIQDLEGKAESLKTVVNNQAEAITALTTRLDAIEKANGESTVAKDVQDLQDSLKAITGDIAEIRGAGSGGTGDGDKGLDLGADGDKGGDDDKGVKLGFIAEEKGLKIAWQ